MTYEELAENVIKWANDKGILDKSSALRQISKTQEELDETRDALNRAFLLEAGTSLAEWDIPAEQDTGDEMVGIATEVKDGIGDMLVTIIILAEMAGFNHKDCLAHAFDEIKGRTGRMVDGLFVKDK